MIYIAGPYSHPNPKARESRYNILTAYAAYLIKQGHLVYSPITHNHPLAVRYGLPTGWHYWETSDEFFVNICTEIHVCEIPGHDDSEGVKRELKLARELGKTIHHISWQLLTSLPAKLTLLYSPSVRPSASPKPNVPSPNPSDFV